MDKVVNTYESSTQLFKNLSNYLYKIHLEEWQNTDKIKLQNVKSKYIENNKINNKWILEPIGLSPNQYKLLWKIRTNTMKCQDNLYKWKMSSTNYCQRCIKAKINHPFIQNNKHIL